MMAHVVAGLFRNGSKFLIGQRPASKKRGLLWEFVGGKTEPGESPEDALIRECREELGAGIRVGRLYCEVTHSYPDIDVVLSLYEAYFLEEPQCLEHAALRWIGPEEIDSLEFCPADRDILALLKSEADSREEVCRFLKNTKDYFLATSDRGQPRVRPFGTVDIYDGALTIQTGKRKEVSRQMHEDPRVEICAFDGSAWLRLTALAAEEPRVEAQEQMLNAYPELRSMYAPGDGNTEIFRLTEATAVFSSFTSAPRTLKF